MNKIALFPHVISNHEKRLSNTHCLLSRLSERALSLAYDADDGDGEGKAPDWNEVTKFLYEVGHSLDLVANTLEHSEGHLRTTREQAVELKLAA